MQCTCQPLQGIDARFAISELYSAHVAPLHFCTEREFFLRNA